MRTKKDKLDFIAKETKRIHLREAMANFRTNEFVDILRKWDGKVYNKRFRDALQAAMPAELWRVGTSDYSPNELRICARLDRFNYSEEEQLYIQLVTKDGRIDAEATLANEYTINWHLSFCDYTEDIRKAIDKYDECMEFARKLDAMISEYGKLPYTFRQNIVGFASHYLN